MEEKLNAITLYSVDYADSDKMITFFTLEKGIVSVGAKGIKKDKAKLKFTAEPFCFSEIIISSKSGRNTLINADCKKSYFGIINDLSAYFCACLLAECTKLFFSDQQEEDMFYNLLKSLELLNAGLGKTVCVKYILDCLSYSGYGLDFSGCSSCGEEIKDKVFLSYGADSFLCKSCSEEGCTEFRLSTYNSLKYIENTDYKDLTGVDGVDNLLKLLSLVITNRTGSKLNSLKMLSIV